VQVERRPERGARPQAKESGAAEAERPARARTAIAWRRTEDAGGGGGAAPRAPADGRRARERADPERPPPAEERERGEAERAPPRDERDRRGPLSESGSVCRVSGR